MYAIRSYYELSVPESVTNIGDFAFSHNSIRELTISDSLKHMGKAAFNGNKIETFNGEKSSGIIYGLDEKGRIDYTLISSYGGGADVRITSYNVCYTKLLRKCSCILPFSHQNNYRKA